MSQSATSSESSTAPPVHNAEQLIWKAQTTGQCSPIIRQVLQCSECISEGTNNQKIIAPARQLSPSDGQGPRMTICTTIGGCG
eukprot:2336859-Amphidinium_carterae.3